MIGMRRNMTYELDRTTRIEGEKREEKRRGSN